MNSDYPMTYTINHHRFDKWIEENTGNWDGPDGPTLTRQIMRVLAWYDTTTGHTVENMKRENINSVEIMALKGIFEILEDYAKTHGL
jgi:hypothetical protein